jgi:hypothetical protein
LIYGETQQAPESSAQVITTGLYDSKDTSGSPQIAKLTIEQIQNELLLLSLQQADVQERIRAIRHALTALVTVFGPAILNERVQILQAFAHHSSFRDPTTRDLCSQILKRSASWLTVHDLLASIRCESPLALSRFGNPGVSLSNALRALQRLSQVEAKHDDEGRTKWRWIGEQNGPRREVAELLPQNTGRFPISGPEI